MIINQSTVAMGSRRSFSQTTSWQGQTALMYLNNKNDKNASAGQKEEGSAAIHISKKSMEMYSKLQQLRQEQTEESLRAKTEKKATEEKKEKSGDELLLETLKRLLEAIREMNRNNKSGQPIKLKDFDSLWRESSSQVGMSFMGSSYTGSSISVSGVSSNGQSEASGRQNGVWVQQRVVSAFHHEEETTAFSSMGMVKTADGREINFNIDMEMSRSFTEEYSLFSQKNVVFTDPLVINMDTAAASVSDQKFYFDLDADGQEEEMSYLGKGSGFLAYDKNGDGVINDGSELFGTKSGDGFADLAAYDKDGNGWIDEKDDIYKKLKVWVKAEDGTDRLLDLKKADVGAIYLGKTATEFSLNHAQTNETNAAIRSTGIFLKESGEAGTIQHVDFAV